MGGFGVAGIWMPFVLLDGVNDLEILGDCSGGRKNYAIKYPLMRRQYYSQVPPVQRTKRDRVRATTGDEAGDGDRILCLSFCRVVIEGGELLVFGIGVMESKLFWWFLLLKILRIHSLQDKLHSNQAINNIYPTSKLLMTTGGWQTEEHLKGIIAIHHC